ncbi:7-cyano-7-deazaguanine synthase QueC [Victivallis sp. Marseille-Q1083]|uniref:7-cyano-7-deazaguanine synthase QueC n=1 Tax=Victivallis sp. Marseille-Q1083 TaxID=2717288 RepID=UPI00158972E7|nr:7-cyano-7-deazaguanine synthase QueC [Victivallis sp. Marseille-Q1083]
MDTPKKRAVVLLSGGLDSATCLAIARAEGFDCYALSFDYRQRHHCELDAAKKIAASLQAADHMVIDIDLRRWGGSALTSDLPVPDAHSTDGIPVTYVPARNLIFLSFAVGYAEVLEARDIFIGVNSVDYSGYPDCRAAFIDSFRETARLGTKACDEKWQFNIRTPLQTLSKAEIIRRGLALGVDYSLTTSCYNPDENGFSCGKCDSCALRHAGFAEAGVADPTRYRTDRP